MGPSSGVRPTRHNSATAAGGSGTPTTPSGFKAFFFIDELEAVIRDWITTVYHRRLHRGLCISEAPG